MANISTIKVGTTSYGIEAAHATHSDKLANSSGTAISAGSAHTPVYFNSNGIPVACTMGVFERMVYFSSFADLKTKLIAAIKTDVTTNHASAGTYFPVYLGDSSQSSMLNLGTFTFSPTDVSSSLTYFQVTLDFCFCKQLVTNASSIATAGEKTGIIMNLTNTIVKNLDLWVSYQPTTNTGACFISLMTTDVVSSNSDYYIPDRAAGVGRTLYCSLENCNIHCRTNVAKGTTFTKIVYAKAGHVNIVNSALELVLLQATQTSGAFLYAFESTTQVNLYVENNKFLVLPQANGILQSSFSRAIQINIAYNGSTTTNGIYPQIRQYFNNNQCTLGSVNGVGSNYFGSSAYTINNYTGYYISGAVSTYHTSLVSTNWY